MIVCRECNGRRPRREDDECPHCREDDPGLEPCEGWNKPLCLWPADVKVEGYGFYCGACRDELMADIAAEEGDDYANAA